MTNFFSLLKNVYIHREMCTEGRWTLWHPSAAYEICPLPALLFLFRLPSAAHESACSPMQHARSTVPQPGEGAHGPCSGSVVSSPLDCQRSPPASS